MNKEEKVLITLYAAVQGGTYDLDSVKPTSCGLSGTEYAEATNFLQDKGYIVGAVFTFGGQGNKPLIAFMKHAELTDLGKSYAQELMTD
jgi:hypothetical protein